jgi:integrase
MKLSEAIAYFDLAKTGEVADATRRWFYWHNPKTGVKGGRLWTLVQILGDVPLEDVGLNQLRLWRAKLQTRQTRWADSDVRPTQSGGLSQDGFRNYIRAARQFFKFCYDEGLIPTNPAERLPVPPANTEKPKAIPVDDAWKVLHVARIYALRDMAYRLLHEDTGAKIGEVNKITCDDLDLNGGAVTIHQYAGPKTYQPVTLGIGWQTAVALNNWRPHRLELAHKDELHNLFTGMASGQFRMPLKGGIAFGVRNNAIAQTLASSACRAGGIASMRLDSLNLDNGTATVWEKGTGGYRQSRVIYLDDDACAAIDDWRRVHPGETEQLFPGLYGPLTRDGVYQIMTKLAKAAGVKRLANPHAWRHAWSIEALRAGADVPTVAKVLGNKPATVMNSYSRWAAPEIQQRHLEFSWKNGRE